MKVVNLVGYFVERLEIFNIISRISYKIINFYDYFQNLYHLPVICGLANAKEKQEKRNKIEINFIMKSHATNFNLNLIISSIILKEN